MKKSFENCVLHLTNLNQEIQENQALKPVVGDIMNHFDLCVRVVNLKKIGSK